MRKMVKRFIYFVKWYKHLRLQGYMWHNCVEWAAYNSATHELDGSYIK
jgi:hypothetical protein